MVSVNHCYSPKLVIIDLLTDWIGTIILKKVFLFLLCVLFVSLSLANAEETDYILFYQGGGIILSTIDGKKQKVLVQGDHADPSPDGRKIAYTYGDFNKRSIAIYDFTTKKITKLEKIPGDNNYGPIWSPDGNKIAFRYWSKNSWKLAIANANDSGFTVIKGVQPYQFCWDPGGQHLWLISNQLNKINLEGKSVFKYNLASLKQKNIKFRSVDSDNLLFMKTNQQIILTAHITAEAIAGEFPSAIFRFNFAENKLEQLTPDHIFALWPSFSSDKKKIIFSGFTEKDVRYFPNMDGAEISRHVYSISVDGSHLEKIADDVGSRTKCFSLKKEFHF